MANDVFTDTKKAKTEALVLPYSTDSLSAVL